MRDRLIELIEEWDRQNEIESIADYLIANGVIVVDTAAVSVENRPLISQCLGRPLDEIIELVQAKKDGRVIVPPCKVGDTVYCIIPKCNAPYNYCSYNGGYGTARCGKEPCKAYIKEISFSLSDIENIGKTVFLTREQAECALAESGEK